MKLSPKVEQPPSPETFNGRVLSRIAQSKSTYWFGFFSDPLTVVLLICWDVFVMRSSGWAIMVGLLAGLFIWTLVEYGFHRWIYHKGETLAHAGHLLHHDEPEALIGMPWFLTSSVVFSLWLIFSYLLELPAAASVVSGILGGFVFYYAFHHVHHHYQLKSNWYRKLRAHHKIHHQIPTSNYGVTNRFWDQVFRTTYRKSEATVKRKSQRVNPNFTVPARVEVKTEVRAKPVSVSQT